MNATFVSNIPWCFIAWMSLMIFLVGFIAGNSIKK